MQSWAHRHDNAGVVACPRMFERCGWRGREGGWLSYGLTHIKAPGGQSRPGARPLLFLDRHPNSMDAAVVTSNSRKRSRTGWRWDLPK